MHRDIVTDLSDDIFFYHHGNIWLVRKDFGDNATKYYYDSSASIILETDQNNLPTARNIRGLSLIYRENNPGQADTYTLYYLHNAHGDVTQLLNEKGDVVKDYRYDTFGQEQPSQFNAFGGKQTVELWRQEVENVDNPFRYCGEYQDSETGNYYLRARYYDASIQRFINEDSFSITKGSSWAQHSYNYVGNNPINRVDPTGNIWLELWDWGKNVRELQLRLYNLGLLTDKDLTGYFNKNTQNAVNKYKESRGIYNDYPFKGDVGNQTWEKLLKESVIPKGLNNKVIALNASTGVGWLPDSLGEILRIINCRIVQLLLKILHIIHHKFGPLIFFFQGG